MVTRQYGAGVSSANRRYLDALHRSTIGPFTVREAAGVLRLSPTRGRTEAGALACAAVGDTHSPRALRGRASGRLGRGLERRRLGHRDPGLCAVLRRRLERRRTLGLHRAALRCHRRPDDPGRPSREGDLGGVRYLARRIPGRRVFGTKRVWRDRVAVEVSDPTRTLVDVLDEPRLGGGARHVAEMLRAYLGSEHRDDRLLLEYAHRLGNRAVFKRLGFLAEALGTPGEAIVAECARHLSAGYARLDPSGPRRGRLVRRWRLQVNATVPEPR